MIKTKLILKKIFELLWLLFIIYGFHMIIYLTLGQILIKIFNKVTTGYLISLSVFIILSYKSKLKIIWSIFISFFSEAFLEKKQIYQLKLENI